MIEETTGSVFAAGAIIAAIFSALLTLISLIVSKEQTTSGFRQKWIDALREDLALFLTSAASISVHAQMVSAKRETGAADSEIIEAMSADLSSAYSSYHRIILRLNPEEHKKLIGLIVNLERTFPKQNEMADSKNVGDLCAEIDHESHIVLKNEWQRVKRGEPAFVIVKYASIVLLVIALVLGAVSVL